MTSHGEGGSNQAMLCEDIGFETDFEEEIIFNKKREKNLKA